MISSQEEKTLCFVVLQVPLSALSPTKVQPGAVGGSFNSTSRIKRVPLPTLYNQYQATRSGVRNVSLHSHRYTPSTRHTRTVSDSLLVLPHLVSRQKGHLAEHRKSLQRTQSLKTESQVVPHRVEKAFYMSGHMAHLFDREEIPQEEVRTLETVTLSQNPSLYYGKGIKSCRIQSKTVQRFENKLKEVSQISQHYDLEAVNFDAGRYSRASRGITPSSPIPEEDMTKEGEKEEEEERRKTFMTESQRLKLKTDNRNL